MPNYPFDPGRFAILDGAMGTQLQAAGLAPGQRPEAFMLEQPEKLEGIHRAYIEAGAQAVFANTFGANAKKLAGSGIGVEEAVGAAVACAKRAADGKALVGLDIGPLGEMLEPGGTLLFEEAYGLFAQVVRAGAGADFIVIETMADVYEVQAAVLAALENSDVPVLASMTFEADGRSFAGVPVEAFAATIGAMGVAALGINCSLGPAEVMPLAARLCAATTLPVYLKPNAGLPDPATGEYHLSPEDFCRQMEGCRAIGVNMVGGCCGTTPETIRLLAEAFAGAPTAGRSARPPARVCGATHVVELDRPLAVGERINPTGKKDLREALLAGDVGLVQKLATQQEEAGAAVINVNVGAPGVDEAALLPRAVKAVQAVSGLPLMLDSADPAALEAALRVCAGRPIVNSTSGERAKLDALLPLCKKYGAALVGLALDEDGIPDAPEARLAVAQKIRDAALEVGLGEDDLFIDCLTMTAGADPAAAVKTLRALALVKRRLGLRTVLGVSNVSFGLPGRPVLNRTFLAMALSAGLDLAIMNPNDAEMTGTLAAFSLLNDEEGGVEGYLACAAREGEAAQSAPAAAALTLDAAIEKGLKDEAATAARALLAADSDAGLGLVNDYLIPALDRVGQDFESGRLFLPQLLAAAGAAQAAFEVLRQTLGTTGAGGPPVVVATVQGDVHDIGKNIAKVLLENYGFHVIDLGRDVPPQRVVEAARDSGARLVGLSALMTTTLPAMERTIAELRAAGLDCKVLVGGAVLTGDYAAKIGADFHARDAKASADYARQVYGV